VGRGKSTVTSAGQPAGAWGEHQNSVGEEYRFIDAVRHEQHRCALRRPDIEKLGLEAATCLHVQRADQPDE
jgi:hypothetical protein